VDDEALLIVVEEDPKQTLDEITDKTGIDRLIVFRHIKAMSKVSRAGVWVPHQLAEQHKVEWLAICSLLLSRQSNNPFLKRIVTGDERWVMYDDPKRRREWLL